MQSLLSKVASAQIINDVKNSIRDQLSLIALRTEIYTQIVKANTCFFEFIAQPLVEHNMILEVELVFVETLEVDIFRCQLANVCGEFH